MSKRESVATLLRTGRTVPEICRDLEVGRTMVFTVKKLIKEGKNINQSPLRDDTALFKLQGQWQLF